MAAVAGPGVLALAGQQALGAAALVLLALAVRRKTEQQILAGVGVLVVPIAAMAVRASS